MRQHVILFLCRTRFSGESEIAYTRSPAVGSDHDCILFVSQPGESPDYDIARTLLAKHGWVDAEIKRAGPFKPENVNSQQWQAFQPSYEECLTRGDSVIWYE